MNFASNRLILFGLVAFLCIGLIAISLAGLFRPLQAAAALPFNLVQQGVSGVSRRVTGFFGDLADLQSLKDRNAQLERALVNMQAEVVRLREINADYDSLSKLLNYKNTTVDIKQALPATVIGRDTTGLLRTITIDHGTRDGLALDMPVVTELGLVGRINQITATTAQVQLITDVNSFIQSRLQLTRSIGLLQGTASGDLQMINIPLTDQVKDGDSVITSGIGGKFPRGIIVGQVTNSQIDDSRLFQKAQVRSLVDFNHLEIVLIITDFKPVDPSEFNTPTPNAAAPAGQ